MALAIGNMKLNVKKTGVSANVPDNPKAKLMYYLSCICNTLELDTSDSENIQKLRDYKNYFAINDDDVTQLLVLCAMLSPDILINKIIFQNDEMCEDRTNQFYRIETVRNQMVVSNTIVIGGQTKRVNKIMTYKRCWLTDYYLEPMKALSERLQAAQAAVRRQREKKDGDCVIS